MVYRTRSLISKNAGRIENRTGQKKDLIRLFNKYFLSKRTVATTAEILFWTRQSESETPEDFWQRLIEMEQECAFERITAEDLSPNS